MMNQDPKAFKAKVQESLRRHADAIKTSTLKKGNLFLLTMAMPFF